MFGNTATVAMVADGRSINCACIFDLDGLLIDSEPIWRRAEREVFATVGVNLTDELCRQTTGLRIHDAVEYWFRSHPWKGKSRAHLVEEIVARVAELLGTHAEPLPGATQAVRWLADLRIPLAICSSSSLALIEIAAAGLDIRPRFQLVYSTEAETQGKPHPAGYLSCASRLRVSPQQCIVFEDSVNGALAGKAAGMRVVAVPASDTPDVAAFDFCDRRLRDLTEFTPRMLGELLGEPLARLS